MALSANLDTLGIRPLEAGDAADLYALIEANRSRLAHWMSWAADQDLAGTERFIAEAEKQMAEGDGFQGKIEVDGKIIGTIGVRKIDWVNRKTSIGAWLVGDAEGRGTMTNAARALVDHAFREWNLHRIEIRCAPNNHRTRKIAEHLGFREEARLRHTDLVGGRYLDTLVFGLLESEWD
jgi:ribosomal-protein-serine acetyltransferase